jgi:hypothetical protein
MTDRRATDGFSSKEKKLFDDMLVILLAADLDCSVFMMSDNTN